MIILLSYDQNRFRWVFCQLEVLRHCFPTNLRHVLEELPKTLDDTYKRILKEINNSNWGHAYRLLQCLAVASRPLQVEELAEVLAFDLSTTGIPKLNEDWRWENQEQAVLSACSSLVSVITNNGSRIVQFSHFSVKEFLTSHRLASCMDVSQFYIPIEPSHMILAQACIGVLLCLDDRTDEDSVRKIPLYRYAAEYWVGHAQFGNVESEIKDAMYYLFDVEKPHLSAWVRLERPYDLLTVSRDQGPRDIPPAAAPLYFAAWKGFRGLVERLIAKNSQQVHHLGGLYGAPLSASVDGGHIEVAQLLFTHGANINARSADNWTPLHIASLEGHLEIVKWLLDKGADASSREKYGMTPLHFAASGGHLEVCQTLFERGEAEVNSWAYNGYTPLLCATESGNPDVLQLLLDHNADMHMTDIKGNTPLHLATEDGDLKIAQILLEHKVDVNSRNDDGSTPFLRALETGNLDVAWLLLDHNADVHMHDNRGNTPLQRAACSGLLEVSRKILDRSASAEVNSCNYHGSTPLLLASEEGHADVVRLLLDFNADMYARDGDGDTALHCAALRGRLEVSQILLELNLDVNSRNNSESTPLHRVLEGGREGNPDVARLLLDYGADVQARDLSGRTAFELARDRGQHEIVGLLPQHASE
jgi:ankyrin repeat protein